MKRFILTVICVCCIFTFFACVNGESSGVNVVEDMQNEYSDNKTLSLFIGETQIPVTWENNDSVTALIELAKGGLTVNMRMYGGFEQVGNLGKILPSNDKQVTTAAGDIVLYSSDQIVLFYGSNTWRYTKLGRINLNKEELTKLLGETPVTLTILLK